MVVLSVHLFVTIVLCVKTAKHIIELCFYYPVPQKFISTSVKKFTKLALIWQHCNLLAYRPHPPIHR